MDYIEYINNLRVAFKKISALLPEIEEIAARKALRERDIDLSLISVPDDYWIKRQEAYLDIEDKIYHFNPDEEYGSVHTMSKAEMQGE
jgi:hypothetical protein